MLSALGAVAQWQRSLAAAISDDSGLDPAGLVDTIRGLEELVCTATAARATLSAELDATQQAEQAAAGIPASRRGGGVAAQLALARRESPTAASG